MKRKVNFRLAARTLAPYRRAFLEFVVCLAAVFLFTTASQALDPQLFLTQYAHTDWRTQDGSAPSGIFSITQTADGFLWALSLAGDIYRFDGVRYQPWRVTPDAVGKVFADRAGGLWVEGEELYHLRAGSVSHLSVKGLHGFQSFSEDADGSLWIGLRSADAPLCHIAEGRIVRCFGKDDGIPLEAINAILPDGSGGYWLGGRNALVRWSMGGRTETYPTRSEITSLARSPQGLLWVGMNEGTGGGLGQLRGGSVQPFVSANFDGSEVSVTSLMLDRDSNLWVATDAKGIFRIRADSVAQYNRADGLSGDSAWALYEDREGVVWVGTTSGIDSFRDPSVVTFSSIEGLGKDLAAGLLGSSDGSIWVANDGSLDRIRNGTVSSIGKSNGLPGTQVAAMLEDHLGNLWVGVDDGLYVFKDGRFRQLPTPNREALGMVFAMAEDVDGNIWAVCRSKTRRLIRVRDFQVREVFADSQVPPSHNLAPDPHGGIWMVRSNGSLALFRNGVVTTNIALQPRSSPLNRQIEVRPDGSILVSSENGLVGWKAGKLQSMSTKNGLPCDFVIAFVQDKAKRWWLYTRCGVVEFSDSELQQWWGNPDARVQNVFYDVLDGAQPNIGSFNQAASSLDGRLWFASGVVVQMVDPSKLSQKTVATRAYIESVVADRKEFKATPDLRVPPNPRDLQIEYTSPILSIPQKVNFRYRLDPYDRNWHDAGNRRQAFYTDLPPGRYTFRVAVSHRNGDWNESAGRFEFLIAPAFYQTTWFRLLSLLTFFAMVYLAYSWRLRRLRHEFEMTLDARVSERTRIARDLHDTLLQSFHGVLLGLQRVSHLLQMRPEQAPEALNRTIEQAAEAIAQGRDAVQDLRDSTVQRNDLALAIRTIGDELASQAANPPALGVAVEGTPRNLHPIVRDEIYKVAAECLRNVFRHAEAHHLEVELRYDDDQFRLRVRDDGRGIDPKLLSTTSAIGHYGLPGMRERAKLVGGNLTIWSEVDSGTEIELLVPAASAYAARRRRTWLNRKFSAKA